MMSNMINKLKRTKIWMMLSNHIHVWFFEGKIGYWQFINNRVMKHYYFIKDNSVTIPSKKEVIVMVDGYAGGQGGLTDRLRGALSVYSLCKEKGWSFKYFFNYPFNLQDYLLPNYYDWTINIDKVSRNGEYVKVICLYLMNILFESRLDKRIFSHEIEQSGYSQYHIYTSAFFDKEKYPTLFKELFKPTDDLQHEIDLNKSLINSKYISITFRFQELLGDIKEANECLTLSSEEQKELINKCTNKLISFLSDVPEEYKVLVTSDSTTFLSHVKHLDRVFVVPGKVYHPHFEAEGDKPFMKSFVDLYMIMGAEKVYLFKTGLMYKSGFPEFAALLGGKEFNYNKF